MSVPFTITTPTNMVQLDRNNQGSTAFNVFNGGATERRGRASIATIPENLPHVAWLKVVEPDERVIGIGETEQFKVTIAAPAGSPAGNYQFRLNMVDVELLEEGFVQGPSVTFSISPTPPPPPKKEFPFWLVIIILAGLQVFFFLLTLLGIRPIKNLGWILVNFVIFLIMVLIGVIFDIIAALKWRKEKLNKK